MSLRDPLEMEQLLPAETSSFAAPIPTQFVASDEFSPLPQTARQKQVEGRIKELGTRLAKHQGLSRRKFFKTAAGMAAAFVAMNDVYGPVFGVSRAEAASPDMANERARALSGQFIMDMHTHFLRDDTRIMGFVKSREAVGQAGWNPALVNKPQTIEDLKFANYFKEIYFDSDTKVALISGSGSEEPRDWFLTNEMKAEARAKVNMLTGSKRMFSHSIFMPGMPGWMESVDKAIVELKPDSFKGYTVGDNINKQLAKHPWHLDDEKLLYPFYEKMVKAGLVNICIHKGLYPPATTKQFPHLVNYADVRDVGKAAKDWPQLNFVIYHSGFRFTGGAFKDGWEQFQQTGRVDWVTDLAEIPEKYGVKNVYGDLGQIFAQSTVAEPRLCAAMMGQLVKGLGADHVVWGSDAVWTGAPQWQIEALRRLEIPEDMQKKYGFKPLGPADGPVKRAIFGENSARLYKYDRRAELATDRIALAKAEYERDGPGRTNMRYGYVARPVA